MNQLSKNENQLNWATGTAIAFSSSIISNLLLYPADLMRVRLQVAAQQHGGKPWGLRALRSEITRVFRTTGFRGFYAGLSGGLLGPAVAWGSWYGAYSHFKSTSPKSSDTESGGDARNFLSGIQAGVVMHLCANPIFVLKTRMQTFPQFPPPSLPSVASAVLREHGVRGFYRGFLPSLFLTTHAALHWTIFERLKRLTLAVTQQPSLGSSEAVAIATSSKVVVTLITYPLQLVKTCLMADEKVRLGLIRSIVPQIYRANGFLGFYAGFLPHLIRVVPNSTLTMVLIDKLTDIVKQFPEQK